MASLPKISPSELEISPLERAFTIPSHWYTQPEFHDLEQYSVFGSAWQVVGHKNDLSSPGKAIQATIGKDPIIILRDDHGELRGFFNVCRHRGGPLAIKKGTKTVIQCQYHGWTYKCNGSLRGVPQFDRVELFDKNDFGLIPIRVSVWQGFLFACTNPSTPELDVWLSGISDRIAPLDLSSLTFHKRHSYTINCNWKVYVDNYLEGYHIPMVHPELNKLLDYRSYTTEVYEYYSLQHSNLKAEGSPYSKTGDGQAWYYFIFPNIMLNILPGRLQLNIVEPINAENCTVHFDYYYDQNHKNWTDTLPDEDHTYSHMVQLEDVEICEQVQKNLHSQAYAQGRFAVPHESGVHHFQTLLKKHYSAFLKR